MLCVIYTLGFYDMLTFQVVTLPAINWCLPEPYIVIHSRKIRVLFLSTPCHEEIIKRLDNKIPKSGTCDKNTHGDKTKYKYKKKT